MAHDHITRIREQFTRTAEIYAHLMQTTQARGLDGLVTISGAKLSDRVLDVACGPGFLTMAFAKRCGRVIGLDATDAFLDLATAEATNRGLDNIQFQAGDAEQLPFPAGAFDVVACRAAFHHFSNAPRVLSEMVRVLAPSGRIVVADLLGNEDPDKARLHDSIEQLGDPTHVRALPASELLRIFAAAGLNVIADRRSTIDYDLDVWISAGAPSEEGRREIIAAMESCLQDDGAGLRVRREDGKLRFSHYGAAFVLARSSPGAEHV